MPQTKLCPECGQLADRNVYAVMSGKPEPDHLEDLHMWECDCGWAEDAEAGS